MPNDEMPPLPVDVCPLCYHHVSDPAHKKCEQERTSDKDATP